MRSLRSLFILAVLLTFTGAASAQFGKVNPDILRTSPKFMQAFQTVVTKPSHYTVRVQADGKDAALGTIVEADGWILSKASELSGKVTVKLKDGSIHEAKIVGTDVNYDLAILKIDAKGLPTVEWRESKEAKVGKWVASVGLDEKPVAIGVISVATRGIAPGDQPPKVTPGPNTGFLGVILDPAPDGIAGVKIKVVNPKSPAEKAGLKPDDLVYEAAGRKVLDLESFQNTIRRHKAGDSILLKVKRGDEELELKATLGKLDPKTAGINPQEFMGGPLSTRRGGFPTILQHDTVLKPGDCGGPLVDLDGKTVGINISRAGRTETYAIPAEDVRKLIPVLKTGNDPNLILRADGKLEKKDTVSTTLKGFMKRHDVKLTGGVTYLIEMTALPDTIDPYVIVEDSSGKKLAEDDDGAGFPNARLTFRAPADGEYRVIATTFNPNETGGYTLTVRRQPEKK
jgi:serine protease Do